MGAWRSALRNWKPRLPVGSARPKRRTPKLYGRDKTGEELPDWVADKQRRAEKIRQAKAELEAEGKRPRTRFSTKKTRCRLSLAGRHSVGAGARSFAKCRHCPFEIAV
jgi:hypothetical protein